MKINKNNRFFILGLLVFTLFGFSLNTVYCADDDIVEEKTDEEDNLEGSTFYSMLMDRAKRDFTEFVHEEGIFGDYPIFIDVEKVNFDGYGEPFIIENGLGTFLYVPFTPVFEEICPDITYYRSYDGIEIAPNLHNSTPPYMYACTINGNVETWYYTNALNISTFVNTETGRYSGRGVSLPDLTYMADNVFYVPLRISSEVYDENIDVLRDGETKSVYITLPEATDDLQEDN